MDTSQITDDYMREHIAQARSYTLVLLERTAKLGEPGAEHIVWEHGRRNFALRAEGTLPIVCPVTGDSRWAGIGIFATALEETTRILDGDPGVQAGLFTYEAVPVRGFPGSALP